MSQRTRLQLQLETPYEDDRRAVTEARFVSMFLNGLIGHYDCPPDHEAALSLWASGHPAVGSSALRAYNKKFSQPRLHESDLPAPVRSPLRYALSDYTERLLYEHLFGGPSEKVKRFLGCTQRYVWEKAHRAMPRGCLIRDYGKTWWVTHGDAPLLNDLADRLTFLRVVHHSNLKTTTERPLLTDTPDKVIFDVYDLRADFARHRERDAEGRFVPDGAWDDEP